MVKSTGSIFFFQAEDGIRDHCVTGVQTCALPICVCRLFLGVIGSPLLRVGERRARLLAQHHVDIAHEALDVGPVAWLLDRPKFQIDSVLLAAELKGLPAKFLGDRKSTRLNSSHTV